MKTKLKRRYIIAGLLVLAFSCAAFWAHKALWPSSACNNPDNGPAQPGISARTLVSGESERCYLLYVPQGYNPSESVPLVVSLHGFLSNAESQAYFSGWNDIADREAFIVAYPHGFGPVPLAWNSNPERDQKPVDDVEFIRDLLTDISRIVSVDPTRIYVNGFSNGGSMSVRVGCELSEYVTAIGAVGAPVATVHGNCDRSRPVPLIAFHGTSDPVVDYYGGSYSGGSEEGPNDSGHTSYLAAGTWAAQWAEQNGCDAAPETIPAIGDASGIHFSDCDEDTDVILYTIDGGGHNWPGGPYIPAVGKVSKDINASGIMWEFFILFSLDDTP